MHNKIHLVIFLLFRIKNVDTETGWNVQILRSVWIISAEIRYLLSEQKKFQNKSKNIDEVYQSVFFRCIMFLSYRVTFLCNVLGQIHYTSESPVRYFFYEKVVKWCNKIATAQKLMEEVKAEAAGKNISVTVNIFHSRFIKKDRAKLEEEIIKFGKTYDKNGNLDKQSGIWIATSIVEASLDIDFDYLFTELLDLNSLFQRFGRCNRKGAKNVTMYNCYVYTQLDEGDFILGNKGFIDKTIFELSNKAIHDINGKLSESKKQELINRYLTTENISQSHFIKKFREKYRFIDSISIYSFKKNENKLRNILSETIIPETVYEKYKEEIDTISQKLNSERLTAIERKCLRSNILQYSLEIPYYHWNSYEKAMKKGCVHQYQSINLSPGEKIKVMQCRYDEMGYYRIEFADDVD
ncbi:hypothetical protein [Blautia wexlerae]|uniref:hypothetical protein n=1 Tax=Blautia wexlerae TaxID=418240 RepID=UPI00040813CA